MPFSRSASIGEILFARHSGLHRPEQAAKAQPSGVMPRDTGFGFKPSDCIRSAETAYTKDGGLAVLYGQLAPDGSVVKTAGISEGFKLYCGSSFVFEGPCVIFESQEDACEGILAGEGQGWRCCYYPQ